MSLPATAAAATPVYTRGSPFPRMGAPNTDPGPELAIGLRMGDGTTSVPANMWAGSGTGFTVTRSPAAVPVRISSGVSAGMLLTTIRPVYPAIPKVAGIQGAVVMEAVISTAGRIESLHVVSGPAMLRGAALDAVQAARYQPFRLNGEPTEVATTITIVFQLGN
jgi:protein TonB